MSSRCRGRRRNGTTGRRRGRTGRRRCSWTRRGGGRGRGRRRGWWGLGLSVSERADGERTQDIEGCETNPNHRIPRSLRLPDGSLHRRPQDTRSLLASFPNPPVTFPKFVTLQGPAGWVVDVHVGLALAASSGAGSSPRFCPVLQSFERFFDFGNGFYNGATSAPSSPRTAQTSAEATTWQTR